MSGTRQPMPVAIMTFDREGFVAAVAEAIARDRAEREPSPMLPEPMLDRAGLARWAGCSVATVDSWIRDGLPVVRLGGPGGSPRCRASDTHAWLRARSQANATDAPEHPARCVKCVCATREGQP
jgi:hypothetical protein